MPQNQNEMPLELNNETRIAIATGNNASWLCSCIRNHPLLGKSGQVKGSSENKKIVCPNCTQNILLFLMAATIKEPRSLY
ncbi:hypothetical protein [Aliiglaciecola sp. NS0011-25]|uniref:hypothetical protein n=1 Tax=Aliiglaciecola sp. NS0011-25 TaxID=3127654 RepID=UPI00310AD8AA